MKGMSQVWGPGPTLMPGTRVRFGDTSACHAPGWGLVAHTWAQADFFREGLVAMRCLSQVLSSAAGALRGQWARLCASHT